jgi:Flp pilus assembly pilin Flp
VGQALTEYALIVPLIVLVAIAALGLIGSQVLTMLTQISVAI